MHRKNNTQWTSCLDLSKSLSSSSSRLKMKQGKFTFVELSWAAIHVILRLDVDDKIDCIKKLIQIASRIDDVFANNEREIIMEILQRERLGTTGVGSGVAIPHAKLNIVGNVFPFILIVTLLRPIEFDSIGEKLVDIVALELGSAYSGAEHLKSLARVSRLLRSENFCASLQSAHSLDECGAVFDAAGKKLSRIYTDKF